MKVKRCPSNPIITPQDVKPSRPDFKVVCVFNTGVTRIGDEVLLLLRVAEDAVSGDPEIINVPYFDHEAGELVVKAFNKNDPSCDFSDSRRIQTPGRQYLTSISHFRIARSKDGINFEIDEKPAMQASNVYEMYGIEDPRITLIGDTWYINYSACSTIGGVTTCLASTRDWKTFTRHGVIFTPDNKDVAIFPEKINGKYYALNRPISEEYKFKDVWIAESPDLVCWGNHRYLMSSREGYWDDGRVGCSAVPFLTDRGWLEIYHGATKDDRYCLGGVLLDRNEPWKIISRSIDPILAPEEDYEVDGFFGNVVFNCGVLTEDGLVKIYYGAADTYVAYAEVELKDIMDNLELVKGV
jgi:beta-1,2-mannobiose phosphorylase / 1,2-beta-oligomannan phosphorylase